MWKLYVCFVKIKWYEPLREEMIPGKKLTHYIFHLMLVTVTNQNLPQKYEYVWVTLFLQNITYSSTYDHCFGEESCGEITDTLKRKWPK